MCAHKISLKEQEAVLRLDGPARYKYFVGKVCDRGEVWGLYAEGWAMQGTVNGEKCFPVWPTREYAAACAHEAWANYEPESIEVHEFLDELIPMLQEDGIQIAIFSTPSGKGVIPSLSQLSLDIFEELARIE